MSIVGARVDTVPSFFSNYVGEYLGESVALILSVYIQLEPHDWHYDRNPAEVHTWNDPQYDRSHTMG